MNNKLTLEIYIGRLLLSKPIIARSDENLFSRKMFLEKGASKYHNHNINSARLGAKQLKLTPRENHCHPPRRYEIQYYTCPSIKRVLIKIQLFVNICNSIISFDDFSIMKSKTGRTSRHGYRLYSRLYVKLIT